MANRRDQIRFTDEELATFLETERILNVATYNHDGTIHLVAMWFAVLDGAPVFHTYGKSQKIQNLRRDGRMTGLIEAGDAYEELRGVELVGRGVVVDDYEGIKAIGTTVAPKYFDVDRTGAEEIGEGVAQKRVGVRFEVDSIASWDHRKM